MSSVAALITAAGSSRRWSDGEKKEYFLIEGRPVLCRAVEPFLALTPRAEVLITLPPADIPGASSLLGRFLDLERIRLVEGGRTRQESVRLGLEALAQRGPEFVLIHDGARPWVSRDLVLRVLQGTRRWGACIPVMEVWEAPKRIGPSGLILEDLPRREVRLAQTPQGFLFERILSAHRWAGDSPRVFLDDAEVYAAWHHPVFTVAGERANRKLTFRDDLEGG